MFFKYFLWVYLRLAQKKIPHLATLWTFTTAQMKGDASSHLDVIQRVL